LHDAFHALIGGHRKGLWPTLERLGFWTLSLPYGLGVRLRNGAFDRGWRRSESAPVPVVSVGNLSVGGTGKTPCVETVARFYRSLDLRVAILSRGYGAQAGMNDEALVLEQNLPDVPHLQGADRTALAQVAVEELESEVLVLDDGFQHRKLRRDLDLVLIDATNPWGHGYLLPRGLLREPVGGLKRAHVVLLTRCDQVAPEAIREIRTRAERLAPH
jgi:tetraacyldisaccharide 4'-kinase